MAECAAADDIKNSYGFFYDWHGIKISIGYIPGGLILWVSG